MLPLLFLLAFLGSAQSAAVPRAHWVLVFDCGSTKTTLNLFQFALNKAGLWELQQSLSFRWAKALSRFDPDSSADQEELQMGFHLLFKMADEKIPDPKERSITPVFLYATAGLRALPKAKAEALLRLSRAAIGESHYDKKFAEAGMERVAMITGSAEGLYAWVAVNYLTSSNINEQSATEDVGVLDLGGGSTQIAFRPDNLNLVVKAKMSPSALTNPLRTPGAPSRGPGVFSKTFNDYGNSANIMKMVGAFDDCKAGAGCPKDKVYTSPCLHPDFKGDFVFGPNRFKIEGKALKDPSQRFSICQNIARQVLKKYGRAPINTMEDIRNLLGDDKSTFFAISGYYYASKFINDVKPLASAGSKCKGFSLSVREFVEGARQVCANPINAKNPFTPYSCMQVVYLSVLMTYGYHLPSTTTLYACSALNAKSAAGTKQVKANWALGVALQAAKKVLEPNLKEINRK